MFPQSDDEQLGLVLGLVFAVIAAVIALVMAVAMQRSGGTASLPVLQTPRPPSFPSCRPGWVG